MSEAIEINARYYLAVSKAPFAGGFNVIDRALEYNFKPAVVFSNGTETECREWVLRNYEDPVEHTNPPRWDLHLFGRSISLPSSAHQGHRAIIVVEQTPLLILKPFIERCQTVTVIEKEPDVIALVAPAFPEITVIHGDIFEWLPDKGAKFDTIYFDIWPNVCSDDLDDHKALSKRFQKFLSKDGYMESWTRIANQYNRYR